MGHTYHQNYGHLVFHVGDVTIRRDDLERLFAYIGGVAVHHGIVKPIIGGVEDHVHLLGDFPVTQTVSALVRTLKTTSSYWLKGIHGHYHAFSWQQGYGYFSVSASQKRLVADYIQKQREHHVRMSTEEEFERLVKKHSAF